MVKRKHIDVANRIPLQLTGAGGGGVAFTIVTPDTPEEQVIIDFCFFGRVCFSFTFLFILVFITSPFPCKSCLY